MPKAFYLSFANLTCRFGERFVLIDLAKEVIYPAFFDEAYSRVYGPTAYFFRNVGMAAIEIEGLERPHLTIYGRLIKDTVVTRTQVYSPATGLVSDVASMPSAPSAFFALDLDNHKLMYLPETSGAPTVNQFGLTLQSFARKRLASYIRELSKASKTTDEPKSITELMLEYPEPTVEATHLSGDSNIDNFVERFSKIVRVDFQLKNTNAEFNRAEDFRRIREMKDDVLADRTTLVHENKAGLKKTAVVEEVKVAAAGGNQIINLKGLGEDGAVLTGSNDDLKLEISFPNPPDNRFRRAVEMVRSYFAQVNSGRLRPDVGTPNVEKLTELRGDLDGTEQ
jgi:hypothetical protein